MKKLILVFMVLLPLHEAIAENINCDSSIKIAVVDKYKDLFSYSDEGFITVNNEKTEAFITIFYRLNEFRLTFGVNRPNKTILSFDGIEPVTTFKRKDGSIDKVIDKSLKSMLDGGVGITSSSSSTIPPLLFGFRTVWSVSTVPTTYELDTSAEGIAQCKVIFQYPSPSATRETYWIGPNMLINKVLIERPHSRGIKKRTINYHNIQAE